MFKPRANQAQVLRYRGGSMGVSAVPGSGKTTTLSMLAADLISEGCLEDGQEVLIVTLVNSAVDHFSARVGEFVSSRGLLPKVGYRVRTLHGLAHDIVRERPDLAGVSEDFEIADELTTERIMRAVSDRWAGHNTDVLDRYLKPELSESDLQRIRRRDWPYLVRTIAQAFIHQAKDYRATPFELAKRIDTLETRLPLLELGNDIYAEYEQALNVRGLSDFNDLIVRALQAMSADVSFLSSLRERWPFILEDEAQDSSRLQEQILRMLAGQGGNWVRVGDPNQAIFETFTTASPAYLRNFLEEERVEAETLPHSGRSTGSIIKLANRLIEWAEDEHPQVALRGALSRPLIEAPPAGDPQPNPPDSPDQVHLVDVAYTADEELDIVVRSIERWLSENPSSTVAALVPRNDRGARLVEGLNAHGVPYIELLRSTETTRNIAKALSDILRHLARPDLPGTIQGAFEAWQWGAGAERQSDDARVSALRLLRRCKRIEAFVWPRPDLDWLAQAGSELSQSSSELLVEFRDVLQKWQSAMLLPIDQLLLTVSQDMLLEPDEQALVYKLSVALARVHRSNPSWQMLDLADEMERIANNQRRFIGFSDLEHAFDPDRYPGRVIVSTVHKAKGLEWDRVYILAVNNYNFPSVEEGDQYISERWFTSGGINLQAEALAQLDELMEGELVFEYEEGHASQAARVDYAAERLRLFFVGLTRARRELIVTWNSGRNSRSVASVPLRMLIEFWKDHDA